MSEQMRAHQGAPLRPCPFCGAEAFKWVTFKTVTIECACYDADHHRVMVSADNERDAVKAWNERCIDAV